MSDEADGTVEGVSCLSMTIRNHNPNHKYRFVTMGFPTCSYVMDLGFVKKDDSIYLMPQLTRDYTLQVPDMEGSTQTLQLRPHQGLHISLHESGQINLVAGQGRACLRTPQAEKRREGKLLDLVVNATESLQRATLEEMNKLPTRYKTLPLIGYRDDVPMCLSVYRVSEGETWAMPVLSDLMQTHYQIKLRAKTVAYHFVMWQNPNTPRTQGDLMIWMS